MPKVKLIRGYWDGQQMHPAGSVLDFPEGKAPESAKPVEEEKAAPAAKPKGA
jgi:deoxyribose-phosphate aldolase